MKVAYLPTQVVGESQTEKGTSVKKSFVGAEVWRGLLEQQPYRCDEEESSRMQF